MAVDVFFYANLVSGSLIGPFVPRGTEYCSLIGYAAYCPRILLASNQKLELGRDFSFEFFIVISCHATQAKNRPVLSSATGVISRILRQHEICKFSEVCENPENF